MTRHDRDQKVRDWTRRFERFQASGLTVARFCEREQVTPDVFYYWARRFRSAGSEPGISNAANQPRTARQRADSQVAGTPAGASVQLRLASGIQISIPADSMEALRCVISCLGELAADSEANSFQRVVVSHR